VAIEKMDKQVRNQLGLQGKKFVEINYTWAGIEKSYLSIVKP
jgi:hypothetical protein